MYTVEFQKKGMWLARVKKLESPRDIDGVISVELSHANLYPKL